MSRVSLIENLYREKKSIFEFNYDTLRAPRIYDILTVTDVGDLHYIATSLKYSGNINKKYELIDQIMKRRGFKKAHAGTNRVVYNFLDLQTFVAKIAVDKVGMKDTPAEYLNQIDIKPFCCKIFECDSTGVCGFVERVNPVSSIYELESIKDEVFNLMMYLTIEKGLVLDDVGARYYMNYGNRNMFGPVLIDYPYMFKLDGRKLVCTNRIKTPFGFQLCGGEIDFTSDLSKIKCTKCRKHYTARDLSKPDTSIKMFGSDGEELKMVRAKIIDMKTKNTILDSGKMSKSIINEEEYDDFYRRLYSDKDIVEPDEVVTLRYRSFEQKKQDIINNIYEKYKDNSSDDNVDIFDNTIESNDSETLEISAYDYYFNSSNNINSSTEVYEEQIGDDEEISNNDNSSEENDISKDEDVNLLSAVASIIIDAINNKKVESDCNDDDEDDEYLDPKDDDPEVTYDLEGQEGMDIEEYIEKYGEDYNGYDESDDDNEPTMEEIEAAAIPELYNQIDDTSNSILFNGKPIKEYYEEEFNLNKSNNDYIDEY